MIFQYIYVLIAGFLFYGSNQVLCRKIGGRNTKRFAEDDYLINNEEREIVANFREKTGDDSGMRKQLHASQPIEPGYDDIPLPEQFKDFIEPTQFENVRSPKPFQDRPKPFEDEPNQFENLQSPKQFEDKSIPFENLMNVNKYTENKIPTNINRKIIKKNSSTESDDSKSSVESKSEQSKLNKDSESSSGEQKEVNYYNKKKLRNKGTQLKQILDIEQMLGNPKILTHKGKKAHKHHDHNNPSETKAQDDAEASATSEGNIDTEDVTPGPQEDQNNPDKTDQHTTSSDTGQGVEDINIADSTETQTGTPSDMGDSTSNVDQGTTDPAEQAGTGSKDTNSSQSSSNATAILPKLPTKNVYSDNSAETQNTNPGYGSDYIYILINPNGLAERHDLKCHPKIQLGNEMKTAPNKIKIKLYTRKNRDEPETIQNVQIKDCQIRYAPVVQSYNFDKRKELKVLTHGHTNKAESLEVFEDIKDLYLDECDVNVIIVDWKQISESAYMLMARMFEAVSMVLGHLLDALIKTFKYKKPIHLIGHGVGAHIMGYVSKFTNYEIYRITGLDPERPYFEQPASRTHQLQKGDATFVDIIHTCKGIRGYARSHGDVDFYPNEGITPQPNCTEDCSHFQSLYYFKESIMNRSGFKAYRCMVGACNPGEATMGEAANPSDKGNFYLKTNSQPPYAMGKKANDC